LPNGFAQQLANELGVSVRAPTTAFDVSRRGKIYLFDGGEWITFTPQ